MKGQTHGGKGSTHRPTNKRRFDENYEKIFNKTPSEGESQLDEGVHTPETNGRSGESKLREHVEGARVQGQADQEQTVSKERELLQRIQQLVEECAFILGDTKPEFHKLCDDLAGYLSQPEVEQEPVAWGEYKHETVGYGFSVPEDEVEDVFEKINVFGDIAQQNSIAQAKLPNGELTSNVYDAFDKGYAQAKIDLAEQAVEQNPVAWIYEKQLADGFSERTLSFGVEPDFDGVITPLYASLPAQRQPLSDDVIDRLRRTDLINVDCGYAAGLRLARLMEKAHGIGK